MAKWKAAHDIKKERRQIDAIPWWADELHEEFLEKIRSNFTDEEADKFIKHGFIEIKYLTHIWENILKALEMGKQNTISGDTQTIEVTIQDQLVGLLYNRRTEFNHSEVTYLIFDKELQKLKKELLKQMKELKKAKK